MAGDSNVRTCYNMNFGSVTNCVFFFSPESFRLDFPSVYDLVFVDPLNTAVRRMPWLAM